MLMEDDSAAGDFRHAPHATQWATQSWKRSTFSGMCQLLRLGHHSMGRNHRRPAQVPESQNKQAATSLMQAAPLRAALR